MDDYNPPTPKVSAQLKWYYKNAEKQREKMNQRAKVKKQLREEYLAEHPEDIEFFREEWRRRYRSKTTNKIKKQIEAWAVNPLLTKAQRETFITIIKEETFRDFTKRDLTALAKMINLPSNKSNERNEAKRSERKEPEWGGEPETSDECRSIPREEDEEEASEEGETSI
jgi:hypothetical protein